MTMSASVDLSNYNNDWYQPGKNKFIRVMWFFFNAIILNNPYNPFIGIKVFFLTVFGARIGKGVIIKPSVNVKYPWNLEIGDYSWIGENVWIDNLGQCTIGAHCCISQGAMLLTGNHNYSSSGFELIVKPITLENGVWIGAQSVVIPGTICMSHSVLTVKSVSPLVMEANSIYRGNPAIKVKDRIIN